MTSERNNRSEEEKSKQYYSTTTTCAFNSRGVDNNKTTFLKRQFRLARNNKGIKIKYIQTVYK